MYIYRQRATIQPAIRPW